MWLILAATLVFLHYLYVRRKFDKFALMGVPHQPGTYPLGSWINWQVMMGKVSFVQAHEKVAQMFPHAKVVGYYGFGGAPKIVINDMELIKRVFIKDFDYFPNRSHMELNPKADGNKYFVNSISLVEAEKWKEIRSFISPIFSSSKLKALMPTMEEVNTEWLQLLERRDKTDVDVKPIVTLALGEVLARIGCGVKPGILTDEKPEDNKFFKAINKLMGKEGQAKMIMNYMIITMFPKLGYALKLTMFDNDTSNFIAGVIKNSINMRRNNKGKIKDFINFLTETMDNLGKDNKVEDDGDEETEFSAYAKERKYKVTQALSQSDLEDLIVGFGFETFISGIDTSGGTFSTTTYYLARHQELQDQVYQEIEEAISNNGGNSNLGYNEIHGLKFLDAFIKESQRSLGISFLERICAKDYPIPELNITIPKDTGIQAAGATIMHDEKYYPNPDSFDPAGHFLSDTFVPSTFLIFGSGPRNCIGMRFGLTMVKSMLVALIAKYKILPGPGFQNVYEIDPMDVNALPKGGIHIKLELR